MTAKKYFGNLDTPLANTNSVTKQKHQWQKCHLANCCWTSPQILMELFSKLWDSLARLCRVDFPKTETETRKRLFMLVETQTTGSCKYSQPARVDMQTDIIFYRFITSSKSSCMDPFAFLHLNTQQYVSINWLLKIPSHLKHVATLPSKY